MFFQKSGRITRKYIKPMAYSGNSGTILKSPTLRGHLESNGAQVTIAEEVFARGGVFGFAL